MHWGANNTNTLKTPLDPFHVKRLGPQDEKLWKGSHASPVSSQTPTDASHKIPARRQIADVQWGGVIPKGIV